MHPRQLFLFYRRRILDERRMGLKRDCRLVTRFIVFFFYIGFIWFRVDFFECCLREGGAGWVEVSICPFVANYLFSGHGENFVIVWLIYQTHWPLHSNEVTPLRLAGSFMLRSFHWCKLAGAPKDLDVQVINICFFFGPYFTWTSISSVTLG